MKKRFIVFMIVFCILLQQVNAFSVYSHRVNNDYVVVALMYHKLSENQSDWGDFCTSPENFEADIKYFKKNNYKFMLASEMADYMPKKYDKIAVITFDDGYKSDFEYALKILEKYSAKATFFVVGEFVGTSDYMSEEEIKKLSDSPCAEIGNHSYNIHKKSYQVIKNDISSNVNDVLMDYEKNRKLLTEITKKEIVSLSYPNGLFTNTLDYMIKKSGYTTTFSSGTIKYRYNVGEPIGRINRNHNYTLAELLKIRLK